MNSNLHTSNNGIPQLFRYAMVGVTQNLTGYIIYLALTWLILDPKTAITILYPIGFIVSYAGNKKWTFSHKGGHKQAAIRFTLVHIIGYSINLGLLYIFVDLYGYSHQYVQLAAILFLAFYFFITLKCFVFRKYAS